MLTSNGTGTAPTWQAAGGGGAGTLTNTAVLGTTAAATSLTGIASSSANGAIMTISSGAVSSGAGNDLILRTGMGNVGAGSIFVHADSTGATPGGTTTIRGGNSVANGSSYPNAAGRLILKGGSATNTSWSSNPGNLVIAGGDYAEGPTTPPAADANHGGHVQISGGLGSTAGSVAGGYISFSTAALRTLTERFRILANGAWSVGTGGAAYGTSGQVLTSNGNAAPTWQTFAADAGSLSGTTLAAGVTASSLTSTSATTFSLGSSGGQGSTTTINVPTLASNNARNLVIQSGTTNSGGQGGDLSLIGGGGASGYRGGHVYVTGGAVAAGTSTGGSILISSAAGSGTGSPGVIRFTIPVGGSGTVTGGYLHVLTAGVERFRILNNGAWSVGSAGTDYGTAGQVLTSNGNAAPTWSSAIGASAPATNATDGFVYIPVTTGTPTGTPTAISGYVPMVADSGGSKLWIYIGGSWKSATLA